MKSVVVEAKNWMSENVGSTNEQRFVTGAKVTGDVLVIMVDSAHYERLLACHQYTQGFRMQEQEDCCASGRELRSLTTKQLNERITRGY